MNSCKRFLLVDCFLLNNYWHNTMYTWCRNLLLVVICFITIIPVTAQRYNQQWRFGENSGIDFNNNPPTGVAPCAINTKEGSASIADSATGALLFYTDGITVWNANNVPMPNGTGLMGGLPPALSINNPFSSTAAAVIIPKPFTPNIYYIVTIDQEDSNNGLRYSVVDMTLNGGLGDVVSTEKNILLYNTQTEKVHVVPQSSGCGYWIISHGGPDGTGNTFVVFKVDQSGINTTPILSTVGLAQPNGRGHIKVNKQHTKLAMGFSSFTGRKIELFNFNASTGIITGDVTWNHNYPYSGVVFYGLEFSPDGSKLYTSQYTKLIQYDITTSDATQIENSAFDLTIGANFTANVGAIQLGPNDKIYLATNPIACINNPNNAGLACDLQTNAIINQNGRTELNFPQWIYDLKVPPIVNSINHIGTCEGDNVQFSIQNITDVQSVVWDFDDPASGTANSSTFFVPDHLFFTARTYNVKVTINYPCTTIVVTKPIVISPIITPTFNPVAPICVGAILSPLPTTSLEGVEGIWNPALDNTTTTTYTFTPTSNPCAYPANLTITVNTSGVTPTFNPVTPICAGATLTPLPTTSNNGIVGTWSPALNNNTTTTYTFTPSNNSCANNASLTITVNPSVTPTFNAIAPFCAGTTAPVLPTTSLNGISGTWLPATVSNTNSATYTFTPNVNQCVSNTPVQLTTTVINIDTNNTITFDNICQFKATNFSLTNSNNINTVNWTFGEPSLGVNNTGTGLTTLHQYTNPGNYTVVATIGTNCGNYTVDTVIQIQPSIALTFAVGSTYLTGQTVPPLPPTSTNGIPGTWSPNVIDNVNSGFYTFTPSIPGCYVDSIIYVDIVNQITPTFTPISTICAGATPPVLPTTSLNGITGTWSPSVVSNTMSDTYVFTPNPGQNAGQASMFIQVAAAPPSLTLSSASATNNQSVCVNQFITDITYTLGGPATGAFITGLPPGIITSISGNVLTISGFPVDGTNSPYNFTIVTTGGNCGTDTALGTIIVNNNTVPVFSAISPFCAGTIAPLLPTTSNNGISGTWLPATINNTTSGNYIFTPAPGQCANANPVNILVTVLPNVTPSFNTITPFCEGTTAPILPTTSNNGIIGSWSPAIINNNISGNYTFTPSAGQCASTFTLSVTILKKNTGAETVKICSRQLPFVKNGKVYSAAGIYKDTLKNIVGCDSIITLNLVIENASFTSSTISTCTNQLPYLWNGNLLSSAGIYKDTLLNTVGCDSIITLTLLIKTVDSSFEKITVCNNQLPYVWNGKLLNNYGKYSTTLRSIVGCDSIANIELMANANTTKPSIGNDTILCPGKTLLLQPGNYSSYTWQDFSRSSSFVVNKAGLYKVLVKDSNGCADSAAVTVDYLTNCDDVYFPSAITPNSNGVNDRFGPLGNLSLLSKYSLRIYNRYGELIFATNNPYNKWSGQYKSSVTYNNTYVWVAEYVFANTSKKIKKGSLVLIR